MNPIKFRVWDFDKHKMYAVDAIQFSDMLEFPVYNVTINRKDFPVLTSGFDRFELMQFTGLTDKNGVEIYEGDILKWSSLTLPITVDNFHGYRFMFGKDQLCKANAVYGEVIGNKFQNPELME